MLSVHFCQEGLTFAAASLSAQAQLRKHCRYHGWHMDALRQWMESDLDIIMVGTWMLCGNGWSLIWTLSWFGV